MNYVRHLNAFFKLVRSDDRLACSHVSLYLALFQYWNYNRFQNPFPVYRDNLMKLSKIGSKNTYHKCIRELHEAKYIYYHPSPTRFLPVKISLTPLDKEEEPPSRYRQLNLFGEENTNSISPNCETDSVPNLTATSTDFNTGAVSKLGHNIKHKHFNKTESKPLSQQIIDTNEMPSERINGLAAVPNQVHLPGSITEVESFFSQQDYSTEEARKFFNHYKAIGWKIKGITPIEDWQAAAHKWMINAIKYATIKSTKTVEEISLLHLKEKLNRGENIFPFISENHFTELNMHLTDEIMNMARKERINQLTGSNHATILNLLKAYVENNDPERLLKDQNKLLVLAKRFAVISFLKRRSNS